MFKELLKELAVKTAPALVAMAGQAVVGFIAQKTGKTEKPERGSMSGNASPSSPKPSVTPVKEALRSGFTKLWAKIKPDIQAAFADASLEIGWLRKGGSCAPSVRTSR